MTSPSNDHDPSEAQALFEIRALVLHPGPKIWDRLQVDWAENYCQRWLAALLPGSNVRAVSGRRDFLAATPEGSTSAEQFSAWQERVALGRNTTGDWRYHIFLALVDFDYGGLRVGVATGNALTYVLTGRVGSAMVLGLDVVRGEAQKIIEVKKISGRYQNGVRVFLEPKATPLRVVPGGVWNPGIYSGEDGYLPEPEIE